MARQEINVGTAPTGAGGDTTRSAAVKINSMTAELYAKTNSLGSAATRNVGIASGNVMEISPAQLVDGNSAFIVEGSRFLSYGEGTTGGPPGVTYASGIRSRFYDGSFFAVDIVGTILNGNLYWRTVNSVGVQNGWRTIYDTSNTTRAQDGTLKAI